MKPFVALSLAALLLTGCTATPAHEGSAPGERAGAVGDDERAQVPRGRILLERDPWWSRDTVGGGNGHPRLRGDPAAPINGGAPHGPAGGDAAEASDR